MKYLKHKTSNEQFICNEIKEYCNDPTYLSLIGYYRILKKPLPNEIYIIQSLFPFKGRILSGLHKEDYIIIDINL